MAIAPAYLYDQIAQVILSFTFFVLFVIQKRSEKFAKFPVPKLHRYGLFVCAECTLLCFSSTASCEFLGFGFKILKFMAVPRVYRTN